MPLHISIHLDGKRLLRARREARPGCDALMEENGGEILEAFPFAALLDDEDVRRLRAESSLPLVIFCEGSRRMRLEWAEEEGVEAIFIETETGSLLDVHETPIAALLPRRVAESGQVASRSGER